MAATKSKRNGHGSAGSVAAREDARKRVPAPGSRLAEAFEAVERFPVLLESRERVMRAATAETARVGEIIEAVESDVALTMAVLQFANRSGARNSGTVASIPAAVEVLKPSGVLAIAGTAATYDFFESNGGWELAPSTSASTPWPASAPPIGSPARSASKTATSSRSRRCCTTSAAS